MKKILVILFALAAFSFAASANSYSVDDASIDALFTEAQMAAPATAAPVVSPQMDDQTRNIVAIVLDSVGLGVFGIHRLILGTEPINCLWYFLTFGGIFGIIPIVDWVVILIDLINGTASYIDNPAFIMWL